MSGSGGRGRDASQLEDDLRSTRRTQPIGLFLSREARHTSSFMVARRSEPDRCSFCTPSVRQLALQHDSFFQAERPKERTRAPKVRPRRRTLVSPVLLS